MTENADNPLQEGKNDKNPKPRFNKSWIFFMVVAFFILFEVLFIGNSSQNATTSLLKDMIANRELEKIVILNKEQAEIFLKKEAIESGKYPNVTALPKGKGLQAHKPQYKYKIEDIRTFESFILETQKNAGYEEKDLIYPEYVKRQNYITEILSWLLLPALLIVVLLFFILRMTGRAKYIQTRSRNYRNHEDGPGRME